MRALALFLATTAAASAGSFSWVPGKDNTAGDRYTVWLNSSFIAEVRYEDGPPYKISIDAKSGDVFRVWVKREKDCVCTMAKSDPYTVKLAGTAGTSPDVATGLYLDIGGTIYKEGRIND